jgi:hypothetical protein
VKVGDLILFGAGAQGIVVEVYKYNSTARVIDFRGHWWTNVASLSELITKEMLMVLGMKSHGSV